jgi:four helix bundle protein
VPSLAGAVLGVWAFGQTSRLRAAPAKETHVGAKRFPSPDTPPPIVETRRPSYPFSHQKLDVYRVALEMACRSRNVADRVPRGYRTFADQLLRSAGQTVLLIGEGANRYTAGQKRQRYTEARGETGEVASCLELFATLRLIPQTEADEIIHLAGRVVATLTRLIQRHR